MAELKFEIIDHIKVLSEKKSGWKKELCLVKWGENEAKYDVRDWSEDYEKCGKGITLSEEEARELVKGLQSRLKEDTLDLG